MTSSLPHPVPPNMAALLHLALRIPFQSAQVSDFLFTSLATTPFHPSYPLTSISDDNTLALQFSRVSHPGPHAFHKPPNMPDMHPDGIASRNPLHIDGPISLTYVATTDNFIFGYGQIDYELSGAEDNSLTTFSGIYRFVCDLRTGECIFTACYGTPPCIMIRATLDSPTGQRQLYKIAVPQYEYVWPHLPTIPLCIVSEINRAPWMSAKRSPYESMDGLITSNSRGSNASVPTASDLTENHTITTSSIDDTSPTVLNDSPSLTDLWCLPPSPINPPSPTPCPLSPSPLLLQDSHPLPQPTRLVSASPSMPMFMTPYYESAPPLSTLAEPLAALRRSVVGKIDANALRVDLYCGRTFYTGAATTSFQAVASSRTSVQREKMWALYLFTMQSRGAYCAGGCSFCKMSCSSQYMNGQRDVMKPRSVTIAPALMTTRKVENGNGSKSLMRSSLDGISQERSAAIRKERNRQSAARSYQRRREREINLENEMLRCRAKKHELLAKETYVREENKQLKRLLVDVISRHSQGQLLC